MLIVEVILEVFLSEIYKGILYLLYIFLIILYWLVKIFLDKINNGGLIDNIFLSSEIKFCFDNVLKYKDFFVL